MTDPPSSGPFRLALLTVLGVVLELLVVEEKLLASAEHEFSAAINTHHVTVNEIHGSSRPSGDEQGVFKWRSEVCSYYEETSICFYRSGFRGGSAISASINAARQVGA